MQWKVPLFDLSLGKAECDAVQAVLNSGWLTMGNEVIAFEKEFANFTGAKHAIAVANCTAALHLALKAVDIGPDDAVICPSLNFCAGPNVISALGAEVVFADITSPEDLCLSPEDVGRKISSRTKAIMVMHYAGYPCDMKALRNLADENGLFLLEDAAHAPGASLDGMKCGTLADAACFSFYSNKNMSTGEGGMITTNDDSLAERVRLLRSHGMTKSTLDRHKGHTFIYDLAEPGLNYRLDEMRAAMGRVQLSQLNAFNANRKKIDAIYRTVLGMSNNISLPFSSFRGVSAYHIRPALLSAGSDREDFMKALKAEGIQTSIHYPPVHQFGCYWGPGLSLPVTEEVSDRLVTLPLYASMRQEQVTAVCDAILAYYNQ